MLKLVITEENLSQTERNMAETILSANTRALQYVTSLSRKLSKGAEESFSPVELSALFEELCQNAAHWAESKGVYLKTESNLKGQAVIQKERLSEPFNTVLNAVEHTPRGKTVSLTGCMTGEGWELCIYDQGKGFSQEALLHGRNGSGRGIPPEAALLIWSWTLVCCAGSKKSGGTVLLRNGNLGGIVTFSFCQHQI